MSVALQEPFDDPQGQFPNYGAYSRTQDDALAAQRHVDIRHLSNTPQTRKRNMLDLSTQTMAQLEGQTMASLEGSATTAYGDQWTIGSAGKDPAYNNHRVLSVPCGASTTTTTRSVITDRLTDTVLATNLVRNPSAETNLTGWSRYAGASSNVSNTFNRVTTSSRFGPASAEMVVTTTATPPSSLAAEVQTGTGLSTTSSRATVGELGGPGATFNAFFSGQVASAASSVSAMRLGLSILLSDGSTVAVGLARQALTGYVNDVTNPVTGTWYDLGCTYTIPTTYGAGTPITNDMLVRFAVLYVVPTPAASGVYTFRADGAALYPGSEYGYFDGDQTGCAWAGDPHQSRAYRYSFTPKSVDLSSFTGNDYISIALPEFPASSLTLASSFVDFTSNASGDFTAGPTFSKTLTGLVTGNQELRVLMSSITGIDTSKITGVRFRFQATATCTVRVGAIRACDETWTYAPVDQHTLYKRLEPPFPPTGAGVFTPTNLVKNPSAEVNASGWDSSRNSGSFPAATHNTSDGRYGTASVEDTYTASVANESLTLRYGNASSFRMPVTAGGAFLAQVSAKALGAASGLRIVARFYATVGSSTILQDIGGTTLTNPTLNVWHDLSLTGTVPPTAVEAALMVQIPNGLTSGVATTLRADGALFALTQSTGLGYFDGSTGGGRWTGTAHSSTSVLLPTQDYAFPDAVAPIQPTSFPIAWRVNDEASGDPMPVDADVTVLVNTGSQAFTNKTTLYFRELPLDAVTQVDLQGLTQDQIEAFQAQPDYEERVVQYTARTQANLDGLPQSYLDTLTQLELDRVLDFFKAAWIETRLEWSSTGAKVVIVDTDNKSYTFTLPALTANSTYVFRAAIEEKRMRVRLHPFDTATNVVGAAVLDTFDIEDDFLFRRRKGRFGWHAVLADGDAYVDAIEMRHVSYGEYRSRPLNSITPVAGAQLRVGGSDRRELWTGMDPGPYGGNVVTDASKSNSGNAFKITNPGAKPLQGLQTGRMLLTELDHIRVRFDVLFPSEALEDAPLEAYLLSDLGQIIPIRTSGIIPDRFSRVQVDLNEDERIITGFYRLVILQPNDGVATTWYIDNISVSQRMIIWDARATEEDPWGFAERRWVPFHETVNGASDGVLFDETGYSLQVRGRAIHADAVIGNIAIIPKYAELGRLVINETPAATVRPSAGFTATTVSGTTREFVAVPPSADTDGQVALCVWDFGDGATGVGQTVRHTFAPGTYTITLTAYDDNGNIGTSSLSLTT